MRVLVQRVRRAAVEIAGRERAAIGAGMLVFVGVGTEDGEEDIAWLASKIARLRIFDDDEGVMNRDLVQVGGEALVVSQFTLQARVRSTNASSRHSPRRSAARSPRGASEPTCRCRS